MRILDYRQSFVHIDLIYIVYVFLCLAYTLFKCVDITNVHTQWSNNILILALSRWQSISRGRTSA